MEVVDVRKPSFEELQQQLQEILTVGHDTLDDEHAELKKHIDELGVFMSQPASYVYHKDNQHIFNSHISVITSCLAMVDVVVSEDKKQMFTLQKGGIVSDDLSTHAPVPVEQKQEKESIFRNPFSKKSSNSARPHDPYESLIPVINKKLSRVDRLELFIHYQSHGIELLELVGETSSAPEDYLAIHRGHFPYDVAFYVITIHKQYIEMTKAKEKSLALAVTVSNQRDLYRTEQLKQQQAQFSQH